MKMWVINKKRKEDQNNNMKKTKSKSKSQEECQVFWKKMIGVLKLKDFKSQRYTMMNLILEVVLRYQNILIFIQEIILEQIISQKMKIFKAGSRQKHQRIEQKNPNRSTLTSQLRLEVRNTSQMNKQTTIITVENSKEDQAHKYQKINTSSYRVYHYLEQNQKNQYFITQFIFVQFMDNQNIHKKLIDRVLSKINKESEQPHLKLTPLSSFANIVYKVQVGDDEHKQLSHKTFLLKIFRSEISFSNKVVENEVVTQLSKNGEYPQVFYTDPKYRIEEFVFGYAPDIKDVKQAQMLIIMDRLADLVKIFKDYPLKKEVSFRNQRKIDDMFVIFQKIVEKCKEIHPNSYEACKQYVLPVLQPHIRKKLNEIVPKQMVATHGDCHFHNVIITNKQHKLYLIDYQFFGPNYRGFELGNFFNEYATDYFTFEIKQELELNQNTKNLLIERYYSQIKSGLSLQESQRQVQVGRLLSHLFWLFIGIQQVEDPKMKNDMIYYIRRRYEQFTKILQGLK